MPCFQKLIKLSFFLIFAIILLASCSPLKPSAQAKNPSTDYHKGIADFYINDSVEQFFVKPIKFNNKKKSLHLKSDFTIRSGDASEFVDAKFSVFSKEKLSFDDFDVIYFGEIEFKDVKLMYTESKKRKFEMRVSGKLDKSAFAQLEPDSKWKIIKDNKALIFLPKRKSQKVMQSFSPEWIY